MYSRSAGSCSRCVLMYCHKALMITGRVCVWMPSSRARRRSSLNCIGYNHTRPVNHRAANGMARLVIITRDKTSKQLYRYNKRVMSIILSQSTTRLTTEHHLCQYASIVTDTDRPGSPASAAAYTWRSDHRVVSPGTRRSPASSLCDATAHTTTIIHRVLPVRHHRTSSGFISRAVLLPSAFMCRMSSDIQPPAECDCCSRTSS